MAEAIAVKGLREFQRGLKKLDSDLPKALRVAFNSVAATVVDKAVTQMPRRTGRARAAVKARSTQTAVRVAAGSTRAPYVPWLDFGGRVGRGNSIIRYFLKDGRYLYPTYFKLRDSGEIQDALSKALLGVVHEAGLGVD